MMVKQVTITLEQPEYSALLQVAIADLRDPPDQLRHILRTDLERRGLWPPVDQPDAALAEQRNQTQVQETATR